MDPWTQYLENNLLLNPDRGLDSADEIGLMAFENPDETGFISPDEMALDNPRIGLTNSGMGFVNGPVIQ